MPGPYPYVGEYPAKCECDTVCRISKWKACADDIRQTREFEVSVWESVFLVPGILCGHGMREREEDSGVHPRAAGKRYHGGPDKPKGVRRPVYGRKESEGIKTGRFSGGL